ncbi:hypothetical protein [Melaminivora alkalimesophila]|uniref:Two-component sensor kinase n=1 Tax=Melaminivora alkalimesophila TaxID=1165852 RepID=A0A317RHF3_9BURK|nr:hypothetical protein [Melaminivora alkalimesophila]PWW48875.1 hypothetical protein DFR36_101384 [Melaminivora alkalimesophila]
MVDPASSAARPGRNTPADPPSGARVAAWLAAAGLVVIVVQLLAFDRLLERHVRDARLQAAQYVTTTLQPRLPAQGDEALLAAR